MKSLGSVLGALLTPLMIIFVILALGYALGAINVKGISLGSAGVLLVAIVVGVIFFLCGDKDPVTNKLITFSFKVGSKTITLWGSSVQSTFKTVQDIGTLLFVTSVGLIAGPKFFRTFNKKSMGYILNVKDTEVVRRYPKKQDKENGAEDKMSENFSKL